MVNNNNHNNQVRQSPRSNHQLDSSSSPSSSSSTCCCCCCCISCVGVLFRALFCCDCRGSSSSPSERVRLLGPESARRAHTGSTGRRTSSRGFHRGPTGSAEANLMSFNNVGSVNSTSEGSDGNSSYPFYYYYNDEENNNGPEESSGAVNTPGAMGYDRAAVHRDRMRMRAASGRNGDFVNAREYILGGLSEREMINRAKRLALIDFLPEYAYRKSLSPSVLPPASPCIEQSQASFPTGEVTSDYTGECPICMEEYEEGDPVRTLPCLHTFHKSCVDDWLARSFTCPSCQINITIDPDEGSG
eukprot:Nk52_evm48s2152 gene=Nk52_evmTU48s2152